MTITQSSTRLVALLAGIAVAAALMVGAFAAAQPAQAAALTSAQVSSIISLLQSFGADAATIANVQASLNGQPTSGTGGSTSGNSSCSVSWTRDLQVGSSGTDVKYLQQILNKWSGTMVSSSGAGSPGNETITFGPATKAAVIKFQLKYGITPAVGYFGAKSRAQLAIACGGSTGSTGSTGGTTVPTGSGLSIMAGAQPANGLAPYSASRIPFTNFTVTASNDGDIVLNSVTVQRMGVASDASFSGVELVDSNTGVQIGISRSLNSNHQATIGDTITIPRGTSRTFTVAANRASAGSHGGEIASFAVVAVNTSAAVNGTLPIVGASHTINETLAVGNISTSTSSFVAPSGATITKNIGDVGIKVAGIRLTANSAEDLRIYSIRWRQIGTVSSSDLANVMTVVNGTSYPTTVSSDGKYYTSVFPGGVLIAKGNAAEVYAQVDVPGSGAAARTIKFTIDKASDVYVVGQLYGFGVNFTPSYSSNAWFDVSDTYSVSAGSATTISKASEVPAQNIAVNVPNQILGGFVTDFKGEPVNVGQIIMTIASTTGSGTGLLTSVSIVNENGAVVAGPVDPAYTSALVQTATFTDTITFPTGRHIWTVKGKVASSIGNGGTYIVTTVPSSGWTSVTGQTSGNNITLSQGSFDMNTMSVRAAALVATISTTPGSQSVVANGQGILFANLQLDASQSGEDVRISTLPIRFTSLTGVSSCQIYNGSTALNTGSNVPTSYSTGSTPNAFALDNALTIPKGTVVTVGLKCNLSGGSGTYAMSINSGDTWNSTGVTSGTGITETFGNLTGGTMTVGTGSLTLSVDSSSPATTTVAAGTAGVTMSVLKLRAANEDLVLNELGLQLTGSGNTLSNASGGSSNSGVSDLVQVYLYDGATQVGTVTFTGTATAATSTPLSVSIPKNVDKLITVKADLATIGTGFPGGIGDSVIIDPKQAKSTGASSGTTIWAGTGVTIGTAGVKMYKSYPTLALDTLSTSGIADGRLMRFKVTANSAGSVGVNEFTFTVSSSTGVTITTVRLKAYTDSGYSLPVSGQGTGGQIGPDTATITSGTAFEVEPTTNPVQIPAGSTVYFELTGAITLSGQTSYSAVTTLSGDSSALTGLWPGYNVGTTSSAGEVSATASNFTWSGNSSTTAARADVDWSNGFTIPGLPSGGLIQTRTN